MGCGEGITLGFVVKVNSLSLCVRGKQLIPLCSWCIVQIHRVGPRAKVRAALNPTPPTRAHAHTHAPTRTHPRAKKRETKPLAHAHAHTHVPTRARTRTHAHTHTHTHTHTRRHACIFTPYHLPFVRCANVIQVHTYAKKLH